MSFKTILINSLFIALIKESQPFVQKVMDSSPSISSLNNLTQTLVSEQAQILSDMKVSYVQYFKSYFMSEPTKRETALVDQAFNEAFGIGSALLVDDEAKLSQFCANRETRHSMIENWTVRKFTFNFIARMAVNLMLRRMRHKDDIYCFSDNNKKYFLKNMKALCSENEKLTQIRNQFIDALIEAQKSNFGFAKAGTLCCHFKKYNKQTLDAIPSDETRLFASDLIDGYFGLSLKYVCYFHTLDLFCDPQNQQSVHVAHEHDSLGLNLVKAVAKISSLVL